jgi:protein subunit release factor A
MEGTGGPEAQSGRGLPDAELLSQCRVDTFRAGGKGGQHQNTTESGVRLTHTPTGIVVIAREERSQHRNRQVALERLRERLEAARRRRKPRIATRIPRREKKRRLEKKRRRGETKRLRRRPRRDD